MSVRTRFAPSPTGTLHLGSIRTALFCWLYARHNNGQFVLRIEDTDRARSSTENVDAILEGLAWLGLNYDEGPFMQTDRFERYRSVVQQFLEQGAAYRCRCSRERLNELRESQMAEGGRIGYDGRCRDLQVAGAAKESVVRFKNPQQGQIVVNDLVRGQVVFENAQLDDLIIARSDGSPTYNFTVVVDDHDMQITHVIRGDDHLNNAPRQINMFAALDAQPPAFAHVPMILGPDGAKLSKRHGAVDIREYREQGYLPSAMLNYLVRLGWSHGDQEVFSMEDLIKLFDIAEVNQSASAFNPEKLLWLNQQHILGTPDEELGAELAPYLLAAGLEPTAGPTPAAVAAGFRERAETLVKMAESARYCYADFAEIEPKSAKKHLRPVILEPLRAVRKSLADLDLWTGERITAVIEATTAAFEISMGKLGQPLRVAVTGGSVSPPIDVTLELVGQDRTIRRLDHAIELIIKRAADAAS